MIKRSSPFKLLAIDVDGTLLLEKEAISEANKAALLAAKEHCMLSLCTGRSPGEAAWIIEELELHDNFHILGGGAIVRKPGGEIHNLATLDIELIRRIESQMPHFQLAYLADGKWNIGGEKGFAPYSSIAALANGYEMAEKLVNEFRLFAQDHHVASIVHKDNHWVQVTAPQCHKGSGIEFLINELKIENDQVLVVGDMFNDLPMFEAVPYSVAMGQAPDQVKSKASFITKEVHHDGLAHAVWEFFFEKNK